MNFITLDTFKTFIYSNEFFDKDGNELIGTRRGVLEIISVIKNSIIDIHSKIRPSHLISAVAPCRYGKSNIIRLSARELIESHLVSACLVISPWKALSEQIVNFGKFEDANRHYPSTINSKTSKPYSFGGICLKSIFSSFHKRKNTENSIYLYSVTNALAYDNLSTLTKWVSAIIHETNLPPVIFIDEAHLLGEGNEDDDAHWAKLANSLAEAGAIIVVLTGTPWRADGQNIPGFDQESIHQESIKGTTTTIKANEDGELYKHIQEWQATKNWLTTNADHEVELKRAFSTKALLTIRANWYEATCIVGPEENYRTIRLHEESETNQRRYRTEVTKHPTTIEGMAKATFAKWLKWKQFSPDGGRTHPNANVGCLVVTPSDTKFEESNASAKLFKRCLEKEARNHKIEILARIATLKTSDEDCKANDIIKNFSKGEYDFLLVKSMGCVGLDAPRIKVVCFLGTYRTAALWMQTCLRGATVWHPYAHYCDLILLDDIDNRNNFETLISNEGGEYLQQNNSDFEIINETIQPYDPETPPPPRLEIDVEQIDPGLIHSSDGARWSDSDSILIDHFRQLTGGTDAVIFKMLEELETLHGQAFIDNLRQKLKSLQTIVDLKTSPIAHSLSECISDKNLLEIISKGQFTFYSEIQDQTERLQVMHQDLKYIGDKYVTLIVYEYLKGKNYSEENFQEMWKAQRISLSGWLKQKAGFRQVPSQETDDSRLQIAIDLTCDLLKPLLKRKYSVS